MHTVDNESAMRRDGGHEFSLGDELRGERATLGKSLLDVQRDLRIKAGYIAAIEDLKPEIFPNQAFVPGYVKSYARYLNLDPDEVFLRFCNETDFSLGQRTTKTGRVESSAAAAGRLSTFVPDFPLAAQNRRSLSDIPLSALGSLAILIALLAGLGYGGWTVLQNIQRVQFAPVEELPVAISEIEVLESPKMQGLEEPELTELASPVAATDLAELYRHQELEVPILMPRDGPIAAINPDKITAFDGHRVAGVRPASNETPETVTPDPQDAPALDIAAAVAQALREAAEPLPITVLAERAAWMRVYLDNGTIIFERILEKGETYSPPHGVGAPLIWAGNSGSVYVKVGDALHGPLGSGTRAVRDVVLAPDAIVERYARVEQIPEVLSQTMGPSPGTAQPAMAIQ